MTAVLLDGPPLWPLVAVGALAAVTLTVAVVVALVRAWRTPVTDIDRRCAAVDDDLTREEHWALIDGRERRLRAADRAARREARRVVTDEHRVRATIASPTGRVENVVPRRVRS